MKNSRTSILRLAAAMLLSGQAHATGGGPAQDEYQVKAAFAFNFVKFVEWPGQAFTSADEPIAICVLGQSPLNAPLEDAVRGKTLGGRSVMVKQVFDGTQSIRCQILFISASEKKKTRAVLEQLKDASVLTVGESDEFIATGGMINLKLRDARVRLEIAPEAAERARLKISSKLLMLADIRK